jgi:hypothetical protein
MSTPLQGDPLVALLFALPWAIAVAAVGVAVAVEWFGWL